MSTTTYVFMEKCASNEYPQHMILWRNKKKYPRIIIKYSSLTISLGLRMKLTIRLTIEYASIFQEYTMTEKLGKNLKEEYLSCSICLDQYKDPRRLPCDHIFCRSCLVHHVTQTFTTRHFQNYVTCPLCRTEYEGKPHESSFIPEDWVNNLPSDSLTVSLMQTLRLHEENLPVNYTQASCTSHGGKTLDAFCLTHAQLICWECAHREHKNCDVDSADKALPKMLSKIDDLRDQVAQQLSCAQELSKNDRDFDDSKSKALKELARAQYQFEKVKTSVERQFKLIESEIDNCNRIHLSHRRGFYSMVASLLENKCTLESSLEDGNATEILRTYEIIVKATSDATRQIETFKVTPDESNVAFVKDSLFENFISKYSSIGYVETGLTSGVDGLVDDGKAFKSVPTSIAHILNRSSSGDKVKSAETGKHQKSFRHMQDIDACLEKEESCFINGIVTFDGEMVYILDRENEKVKQFDLNGILVDVLPLSGPPHDITCLRPNHELGITQPDEKLIAILSGNGLAHRRYIQAAIPYNGICQVNDEAVALSSWSMLCVDIMSIHGQILYHISKDAHDLKCDLPNLLCTISHDRIVLTELGRTIMCLKSSYHPAHGAVVQWTHTAPERIYGVCADNNNLIYACVKDRNEVRTILDDGSLCEAAVLSEKDGIYHPMSIYHSCGKLFVANENKIKVFKIVN